MAQMFDMGEFDESSFIVKIYPISISLEGIVLSHLTERQQSLPHQKY